MEMLSYLFLVAISAVGASRAIIPERVERFENPPMCSRNEVCGDVFSFDRTMEDGSKRPEIRVLLNCECPSGLPACATSEDQMIFRETTVHGHTTCEPAPSFRQCVPNQHAKVQNHTYSEHLGDFYTFYTINCVCPDNEHPGQGFYNRATVRDRLYRGEAGTTYYNCKNKLFE